MSDREKIISKIYYDLAGYGSMKDTYKEAKQKDPSNEYQDVTEWFKNRVQRKTQLKGQNSYIAHRRFQEYQIDLFFINDLGNQKFNVGMAGIDIFTKKSCCSTYIIKTISRCSSWCDGNM